MRGSLRRATALAFAGWLVLAVTACGGTGGTSGGNTSGATPQKPAAGATSNPPTGATQGQQLIPMNVGYGAYGTSYADLYVAESLGLFKKHGLNVKLILTQGNTGLPALISGSVDVAANGGDAALKYISQGVKNLRVIGQVVPTGYLEVWAQPDIKTPKDLIGKTISATQPGALGDILTGIWLKQNGIDRSQVKIVYLNGLANLVAGMKSGKTDATLILPPLGEQLLPTGQHKLGDLSHLKFASHMDLTTTNYAASHGSALVDFLEATSEAISILKTQPDKVLPIIAQYTKITNPQWNKYGYDFFEPMWPVDPKVDMSVMESTQKVFDDPAINKLNVADYVDNSFAQKVEASGFLATLPAK